MPWRNGTHAYGRISILLHWSMAVLLTGQFALGQYIAELDYHDPWYLTLPDLHRSLGVTIGMLLVLRLAWRGINPVPTGYGQPWERRLARAVHLSFYVLLAAIVISGYFISTADGQPVSVFGWFEVPALVSSVDNLEDLAGEVHETLTSILIALVSLHVLAALKHHLLERDPTLKRMLGLGGTGTNDPADRVRNSQ